MKEPTSIFNKIRNTIEHQTFKKSDWIEDQFLILSLPFLFVVHTVPFSTGKYIIRLINLLSRRQPNVRLHSILH